jgi:hypothetical protein
MARRCFWMAIGDGVVRGTDQATRVQGGHSYYQNRDTAIQVGSYESQQRFSCVKPKKNNGSAVRVKGGVGSAATAKKVNLYENC